MHIFRAADLTLAQPLLDAGYAIYNTVLAPLGGLLRPKAW